MTNLPGVYQSSKKDGTLYYRSSITFKNKHISLGSYSNEDEAHKCYLCAKEITTNLTTILDYHPSLPIRFDKWVSLINYRDHSYYFKNPIYLSKKHFTYHLSMDEELYFDIEDLFYYSTHKIHKRDGYYFVNDYGMQINILSRYGIKNHAVEGRDFYFIDGDNHNFRYDNIVVSNPYYGVLEENHHNKRLYKATININGSYIIGRYTDLTTAAIAYNKTVDFLFDYQISTKEFPKNYIGDLSKEAYITLYKEIKISKKILDLFNKNQV